MCGRNQDCDHVSERVCRQLQPAVYEFVWGVMNLAKTLVFSFSALFIRGGHRVFFPLIKDKEYSRLAGLHGGSNRPDGH
ncbi:hypothetical protein SAMN05444358_1011545 [Ruegeria halocynthiae]|uniref:Uncharacterized protein n=1 Tax=Ruegeria halocynthiae TaxID=985054 RepID=A0A1H2VPL9_9RHOB|nr:hypothetical protein SAMN05444358_1011545 [Ruegeria halocynthiae]